ncbi:KUP/HAK/KT family potassium transporter, partial [Rhizobium leguminosarum]|uniref:KUP/HAK/KT family potassium transporter n=1 Tax=Rhizobium leguminosarum TaxID=384 RepID=UPI003F9E1E08
EIEGCRHDIELQSCLAQCRQGLRDVLRFPALTLNYLGKGALVLGNPATMYDPLYLMYPKWALLPVVILATAATIIASQ